MHTPIISILGGKERWIPGICWSANLGEPALCSEGNPSSKNKIDKEDRHWQTVDSICMYTEVHLTHTLRVHVHTHTHTNTHAQRTSFQSIVFSIKVKAIQSLILLLGKWPPRSIISHGYLFCFAFIPVSKIAVRYYHLASLERKFPQLHSRQTLWGLGAGITFISWSNFDMPLVGQITAT